MKKGDLVRNVAERTGTTVKLAQAVIDAAFDEIASALERGERFMIPGFGSFSVVERKERKGRNPQTGEEILIPAKKAVKFSPAKALKEKVA